MSSIRDLIKNKINDRQHNQHKELKPIVIRTINDIKKAIAPFIKEYSSNRVNFSSEIKWKDDDGNMVTTKVDTYSTDPDLRSSLLDGFNQVKEQNELWNGLRETLEEDEYGISLPPVDIDNFLMPVDRLIKNRLGGKRYGMKVIWENIENKKIVFDPYDKSLEML